MDARAFELILITPEEDFPDETGWVNQLFNEGLGTLHLRKPHWEAERLLRYLDNIKMQYHPRIMVHQHPELLRQVNLKGIHCRFTELPVIKPGWLLSCSTHSWQEFGKATNVVDYAFVSPFFDSISKKGYKANNKLQAIPNEVDKSKAVALGGVHQGNIEDLRRLGLRGAAVLGTVWQTADPLQAYRQLSKNVSKWQKNDLM